MPLPTQVAVQADVVDLAARDHDRAGLADFRERVDVVQRIADSERSTNSTFGLGEIDSA
jgi:hypothetical protein